MNDTMPATPGGLIAKSFFNDTFQLWKKGQGSEADKRINISEKGIAWSTDVQYKFKNVEVEGKDWKDLQWLDMTDGKLTNFSINHYFFSRALHCLDENRRPP